MHDPQQDYDLKKVLGRGSFGAVYFAIRKEDQQECAVKRLEVRPASVRARAQCADGRRVLLVSLLKTSSTSVCALGCSLVCDAQTIELRRRASALSVAVDVVACICVWLLTDPLACM
jgi:serine/threonine protein kinase